MGISWNPCDASGFSVISNGGLTFTATPAEAAGCRGTFGQSSGKLYFEVHWDAFNALNSIWALGVAELSTSLPGPVPSSWSAIGACIVFGSFVSTSPETQNALIQVKGSTLFGPSTAVQVIENHVSCFAVDLDNKLFWTRTDGNHWNGNAAADPASAAGGFDISGLTFPLVPFVLATRISSTSPRDKLTANFGDSPFAFAVPYGFTSGWTAAGTPGTGVPSNVATGAVTTNSVALTWSAPSGATPLSYTAQYRITGTSNWTQIGGISGTSTTVLGLASGTEYDFSIIANYIGGPCGISNIAQGTTTGVPPPVQTLSLHRWRGQVGINWLGLALVGDAFAAVVGRSDFENFTEYGNTMRLLVTTPPVQDDRKRIFVPRFELDMEVGDGIQGDTSQAPQAMLDYSRDGGLTFVGLQKWRSMGVIGRYRTRLRWLNLGQARTWIFRLQITDRVRRQIIGTYIDDKKGSG